MGLVRIAFTRAIQDWWYALINLAVMNLIWFACIVTVVAGPPATAALLEVARDAAVPQGAELSTFIGFYGERSPRSAQGCGRHPVGATLPAPPGAFPGHVPLAPGQASRPAAVRE